MRHDLVEILIFSILFFILFYAIWLLIFISYLWITWSDCKQKYENVQYSIVSWCKIDYKWKYIPEELYIKLFEQNLNINK